MNPSPGKLKKSRLSVMNSKGIWDEKTKFKSFFYQKSFQRKGEGFWLPHNPL